MGPRERETMRISGHSCPLITLGRVVAFETCLHHRGGYTCDETMASCYVLLVMALAT